MNIFIVDDDKKFAEKLKKDVTAYFSNIKDLVVHVINDDFQKILQADSVDVLFLDIDLKTKDNGIHLARYIKKYFLILYLFLFLHMIILCSLLCQLAFFNLYEKKNMIWMLQKFFYKLENILMKI